MMFSPGSVSSRVVRSVRRARRAGPGPKRLRKTVSVSCAAMIAFFQFCMHRRFRGRDHARAHLDAFGAEREGRRHGASIDHAAGRDDRHVDLLADQRQQHHGGDLARVLEAAAFAAFDDQPVDAGIDGAQRRLERRHDMEHGEPRLLQRRAIFLRIAGRGGDELHALVDDELDDVRDRARRPGRCSRRTACR